MRIDMPCCSIKTCRYWSDGNCNSAERYTQYEHAHLSGFLREGKEKIAKDGV